MNITNNNFLDRFLSDINNQAPPRLEDLKLILNALIQMHDYGVSFKTAFGLADNRGRNPKTPKNTPQSDSFQSMSRGLLGNPYFLNGFLSKVDQGQQPKIEDLQRVANALIKMRDDKKSVKSAFGILEKTGSKGLVLSGSKIDFSKFYQSDKWAVYHTNKKYRFRKKLRIKRQGETSLTLVSDEFGLDERQIKRILAETKAHEYLLIPIQTKQRDIWKFYFSTRKHLITKSLSEAIKDISEENKRKEWQVYCDLASLYEEVVVDRAYSLAIRGTLTYPKRLTKRLKAELKPTYDLVMSVLAISPINCFLIQRLYKTQIENKRRCDVIESISNELSIDPITINAYLSSLN